MVPRPNPACASSVAKPQENSHSTRKTNLSPAVHESVGVGNFICMGISRPNEKTGQSHVGPGLDLISAGSLGSAEAERLILVFGGGWRLTGRRVHTQAPVRVSKYDRARGRSPACQYLVMVRQRQNQRYLARALMRSESESGQPAKGTVYARAKKMNPHPDTRYNGSSSTLISFR
ncbi:hypothetical protein BJY01DRAFT_124168 [Aspergillus pseudoustus]|uniref:Uncharacterized protein n=1 Tax=Aspergillus pseudoustus TaxID=1810923 RepID=A0ABR4KFQ3_9EURO